MTAIDEARRALAVAHPDLCEPTVVLSEEMGHRKMWLVKRDVRSPQDGEQRRRAFAFVTEWCARRAPEIDVYVDGRAPPGWVEAMAELEDRLGGFPPSGAGGGVAARLRRRAEARFTRDELMRWQDDGGLAVERGI